MDVLDRLLEGQEELFEKDRQRTAREALYEHDTNRNVFYSNPDERMEDISNRSMQLGHPRRAMANEPLRSAGHHPATARDPNQRVNDRLTGLGEEATARRSGGQGVYPSYHNNYDNQFNVDNQYMSQPNFNSHMQYFPGNQSQGGASLGANETHQLRQGPYW